MLRGLWAKQRGFERVRREDDGDDSTPGHLAQHHGKDNHGSTSPGGAIELSELEDDGRSSHDEESQAEHSPEMAAILPAEAPIAPTPFPLGKVVVICAAVGGNTLSILLLVPSVPFMVQRFLPELELEEIGYASGALESVFHVGQLMGAILWGILADSAGRRPVMMLGLIGTIVSCVVFGMSESYTVALVARFLWGLLNANIGVAKTMLAEVSGQEHKTAAFAAIGVVGGLGRLLGPSIGGLLAMPADEIGGVFDSYVWRRWPLLLPCLVAAALTLATLVAAWALLPETLVRSSGHAPLPASEEEAGAEAGERRAQTPGSSDNDDDSDGDEHGSVTGLGDGGSVTAALSDGRRPVALGSDDEGDAASLTTEPLRTGRQWRCWQLCQTQVLLATGLYGVVSFIGLSSQECLPLLMLNDAQHGGLGMRPSQIGTTIALVGPALLLFQTLAYPRLCKWLGLLRTQWIFSAAFVVALLLTPWMSLAGQSPMWVRIAAATSINILTTVARVPVFITTFVLIADASPANDLRASVNGLGQSLCALGRILGPPLMTSLLAWSTSYNGAWPLNWHLPWIVLAILVVVAVGPILANIEVRESSSPKPRLEEGRLDRTTARS